MENNNCTDDDENSYAKVPPAATAENFQKFMYELFEKNGVMNDLRSYLRGHIVNVLKNVQTGDPPPCQKHFTQRLEPKFQALNILIVEYLLHFEFSYSLSVFVSEIPLANMVFSFAKTLINRTSSDGGTLSFNESDIWCILNYLGVKCDSDHAIKILDMYRAKKSSSLLLCILKSSPLFKNSLDIDEIPSSVSTSNKSSDSVSERPRSKPSAQECRHYAFCGTCHGKVARAREKYKKRRKDMAKDLKASSIDALTVDGLMQDVGLLERSLIDEMFEQLKCVYEAEVDMMKSEEEKRVQRSLASQSTELQKTRDELEESFKHREHQLRESMEQKKQFLWGLARALRDQQQTMTRAMHDVKQETRRLTLKEDTLKTQLANAEDALRKRGEDMRQQICEELAVLKTQLGDLKRKRDSIDKERELLQQDKNKTCDITENKDLKSHYDLLKNELATLKKYVETSQPQTRYVVERSTITEPSGVAASYVAAKDVVLNNGLDVRSDDRAKPMQLVNDLKKQKNVNFTTSHLEEATYRSRSRSPSSSSAGDAAGPDLGAHEVALLRRENEQLRTLATQQREHIEFLSRRARPAAVTPTPRPRTAPALLGFDLRAQSASVSNFSYGRQNGAGEELSLFQARAPAVLPGGLVPFVGATCFHADNRRHLINQWRSLRRAWPRHGLAPAGVARGRGGSPAHRHVRERIEIAGPSFRNEPAELENANRFKNGSNQDLPEEYSNQECQDRYEVPQKCQHRASPQGCDQQDYQYQVPQRCHLPECQHQAKPQKSSRPEYQYMESQCDTSQECQSVPERDDFRPDRTRGRQETVTRKKSPVLMLTGAKKKLGSKDMKNDSPQIPNRSPNGILREARLRLRKLEIEAEAVEESYLSFRRKQEERRRCDGSDIEAGSTSRQGATMSGFDKYLKEYQTNFGEHFKNKNATAFRITPIPNAFTCQENTTKKQDNFIEQPLTEFRKYYNTDRFFNERFSSTSRQDTFKGSRKEVIRQAKNNKEKQLEILKQNIGKIYNMPVEAIVETPEGNDEIDMWKDIKVSEIEQDAIDDSTEPKTESVNRNLLKIEIQNSEVNDIKITESQSQDLLVIVESSVDNNRGEATSEVETSQMCIIVSPRGSVSRDTECAEVISIKEKTQKPNTKITNESITKDIEYAEVISPRSESQRSETKYPKIDSRSDSPKSSNRGSRKTSLSSMFQLLTISSERDEPAIKSPKEDPLTVSDSLKSSKKESTKENRKSSLASKREEPATKSPNKDILTRSDSPKSTKDNKIQLPESAKSESHKKDAYDVFAIYRDNKERLSSEIMKPDESKDASDNTLSVLEPNDDPDYPDDFSADVDNYNSRSDYGNLSPIQKTSEDDNFWDS